MIAEKVYVTSEEYLRLERAAEFKSEYVNGEIIPMGDHSPTIMAGASTNHNLIKENVGFQINVCIRTNNKGCRSMSSDQRVYVPTDSLYAYPDIVVVCGPNQYHDTLPDTLTNPLLLVDVLSPGTAAYDRATSVAGDKFALYRHSATLQEYLVVNSEKVSAEVWRKHTESYWFLASEAQAITGSIELASIGLTLSMEAAYAETDGIRF